MRRLTMIACAACVLIAAGARAQDAGAGAATATPGPPQPGQGATTLPDCGQSAVEQVATGHYRYTGNVECPLPGDVTVFADRLDLFTGDTGTRLVATGNVVFTGPDGHLSADRLEYDTGTGLGTFEKVRGILSSSPRGALFGADQPDVYFHGDRLEKLGPRRYRVTRGAWTTCEQPTPRWDFTSGTMLLNLEEYVVARHTVLRVKGVPLFYLPFLYYPIQSDDRATGFLMPTYGTSTFRGQTFSNAFFWAIGRSHDATFLHDVFTRAGQGAGVEYRYVTSPQSSGTLRVYRFSRRETTASDDAGATTLPGATSYELTGTVAHAFGRGVTGRARIDYFSDAVSQQVLHQDLYQASRRNRLIEGSLTAALGPLATSAHYERNEVDNGPTDTLVYGSTPRVTAALAPHRLFGSPVYASMNAEYAFLPYRRVVDNVTLQDDGFGRLDVAPSVRVPLSRLSFLTVNTSATYRGTYYTRQAGTDSLTEEGAYLRQYATARTDVVGPVLTRIFDLPEGRFAERVKHVIEPTVTLDLTSPIAGFRRTPVLSDPTDFTIGGSARLTYGLTNRLFSRGPAVGGARGAAREIVTVGIQQTYYSKPEARRYDASYASAVGAGAERDLSPIAVQARVSPSGTLDANARLEYDTSGGGLQTWTTGATLITGRSGVDVSYSRQRLNRARPASSFVTASTRTRLAGERVGATYAISWDVARSYVVSQGASVEYMAQCCGLRAEYQQFSFPSGLGLSIPSDRRLNFSIVLAGLGTFSNVFGAFGGLGS